MKIRYLIINLSVCAGLGCRPDAAPPETTQSGSPEAASYDLAKWRVSDGDDYPYRPLMYKELIRSDTLKSLRRDGVVDLLGAPDRTDGQYLFYRIEQRRIGFFPLHTRTMVIHLHPDDRVEWVKIHE